jgi:hypothetical protein
MIADDEDFLDWQHDWLGRKWSRLTQKCCAPARLLIESARPYQAVWYGELLKQPWPPPWHSGSLGFLADAAGRAGR